MADGTLRRESAPSNVVVLFPNALLEKEYARTRLSPRLIPPPPRKTPRLRIVGGWESGEPA